MMVLDTVLDQRIDSEPSTVNASAVEIVVVQATQAIAAVDIEYVSHVYPVSWDCAHRPATLVTSLGWIDSMHRADYASDRVHYHLDAFNMDAIWNCVHSFIHYDEWRCLHKKKERYPYRYG